jgi:hypothetical protein
MKPETLEILRARWQRLRIYRYRGSVLVDYRILRNFVRIYHSAGAALMNLENTVKYHFAKSTLISDSPRHWFRLH